jgi:ABC-type Mn2+/Zn2+ transport system ATPase subunit
VQIPGVAWSAGLHAVVGPNGSGKSTSLAWWSGLLGPGARVDGEPAEPGRNVRLLLPRAREHLFADAVLDELAGVEPWAKRLAPDSLLDRHPLRLSGGQAQRVALAKCLGVPAPAYLLDEPEAHLDPQGRRLLAEAIGLRVRQGCVVAVATHDRALAAAAHSVTGLA